MAYFFCVLIGALVGIFTIALITANREENNRPQISMNNQNRCVFCGEIIPEGKQVCLYCQIKHEP